MSTTAREVESPARAGNRWAGASHAAHVIAPLCRSIAGLWCCVAAVCRCVAALGLAIGILAGCTRGEETVSKPSAGVGEASHAVVALADSIVAAAVGDELIPGAVLMATVDGSILHRKAYGFASLYAFDGSRLTSPEPMTVDHIFDLASLTKVFGTTLGIMLLTDRGELRLDELVSGVLPTFSDRSKDSVRVEHLLSHTGGLYPWKPIYYHANNGEEALEYISSLPLPYAVGRERHYSDPGFMLLGYIIEVRSGQTLDAFLTENIYQPLGLRLTGFNPKRRGIRGPFAATSHGNPFERRMVLDDEFGYRVNEDPESFKGWRQYTLVGEVNDGNAYHAHEGVAGHAGLFATADELTVLLQLLLEKGTFEGYRFVGEETVDMFLARKHGDHGLGWAMSPALLKADEPLSGAFGHTGFTGTYAAAFPGERLTIVLLTNRQNLGVGTDGRYNSLDELRSAVVRSVRRAVRKEGGR